MSDDDELRPAPGDEPRSRRPTLPRPTTATVRPLSDVSPNARSQLARTAASTPSAVYGGRVARAAARLREAADVRRRLGDDGHVARGGADVLGGDVGAAHGVDGLAEVEQDVAPRAALGRRRRAA